MQWGDFQVNWPGIFLSRTAWTAKRLRFKMRIKRSSWTWSVNFDHVEMLGVDVVLDLRLHRKHRLPNGSNLPSQLELYSKNQAVDLSSDAGHCWPG